MKHEIIIKGKNNLVDTAKTAAKLNKELDKTSNKFKKINNGKISKTIIGSLKKLEQGFSKLTGSDSLKAPLKGFTKGFGQAKGQGKSMLSQLTSGFKGAGKVISGATGGIQAFIGSMAAALGPIALIAGAFYVLKTMFQANVGGMASSFYKLFGEIKGMIGQFKAGFIKALRKIGPLVKVILQPIIMNIKFLFAIIKGVVKGIMYAIDPILDALGEIGKAFGMVSGSGKQMKFMESVLKGISFTLSLVGKVLGWVIKVGLRPLILGFKILGFIGKLVWNQMAKGVEKWKKILQPVFEMIKKIMDWFKGAGEKSKELKAKVEHKLGIDKVKNLFGSGEGGATTNTNNTDNRRISVFTNQGIDKNSFGEDSMIKTIGA